MRTLLVINPMASSVTSSVRTSVERLLARDHELSVVQTEYRGHAIEIARAGAQDEPEVAVARGGYGALSEVINGLAGSDVARGVIPGGTTSVFSRTIGMTNDTGQATARLIWGMRHDRKKRIGLG